MVLRRFADLYKFNRELGVIFYIESRVLSLTAIVSGVKIVSKLIKAFSATDGTVDNHKGTEKVRVTCAVTQADRLGALASQSKCALIVFITARRISL